MADTSQITAAAAAAAAVTRLTRHVPDFPEPGVSFADLTPVFADGYALHMVVEAMSAPFVGVDLVAGIDARGFLLGSAIALTLGTGVLAVRKKGKLPPPVHVQDYALEYGQATMEVAAEAIVLNGRRVLIVDHVYAPGGAITEEYEIILGTSAIVF